MLDRLEELGLVERRDVGGSTLVRLVRESETVRALLALVDLHRTVLRRLGEAAESIRPAPSSLIVFGSFARGEAQADSDLDVLAVQAHEVRWNDDRWTDTLAAWTRVAHLLTGNRIQLIEVDLEELLELLGRDSSIWQSIAAEGILLMGRPLPQLAAQVAAA